MPPTRITKQQILSLYEGSPPALADYPGHGAAVTSLKGSINDHVQGCAEPDFYGELISFCGAPKSGKTILAKAYCRALAIADPGVKWFYTRTGINPELANPDAFLELLNSLGSKGVVIIDEYQYLKLEMVQVLMDLTDPHRSIIVQRGKGEFEKGIELKYPGIGYILCSSEMEANSEQKDTKGSHGAIQERFGTPFNLDRMTPDDKLSVLEYYLNKIAISRREGIPIQLSEGARVDIGKFYSGKIYELAELAAQLHNYAHNYVIKDQNLKPIDVATIDAILIPGGRVDDVALAKRFGIEDVQVKILMELTKDKARLKGDLPCSNIFEARKFSIAMNILHGSRYVDSSNSRYRLTELGVEFQQRLRHYKQND